MVDAIGYIEVGDAWFLHAWCRLRGGMRAFRITSIEAVAVADEPALPAAATNLVEVPGVRVRPVSCTEPDHAHPVTDAAAA